MHTHILTCIHILAYIHTYSHAYTHAYAHTRCVSDSARKVFDVNTCDPTQHIRTPEQTTPLTPHATRLFVHPLAVAARAKEVHGREPPAFQTHWRSVCAERPRVAGVSVSASVSVSVSASVSVSVSVCVHVCIGGSVTLCESF